MLGKHLALSNRHSAVGSSAKRTNAKLLTRPLISYDVLSRLTTDHLPAWMSNPLFRYTSSPFRYRLARSAAAISVSRTGRTIGLASSELPKWHRLGRAPVFGREGGYRAVRRLLRELTLACSRRQSRTTDQKYQQDRRNDLHPHDHLRWDIGTLIRWICNTSLSVTLAPPGCQVNVWATH